MSNGAAAVSGDGWFGGQSRTCITQGPMLGVLEEQQTCLLAGLYSYGRWGSGLRFGPGA